MKEFKICGEMTEYVEIPVYVCETQKEMVKKISEIRDVLTFVDEARENLLDTAVSNEEETSIYIIYKDGSIYFKTLDEEKGKFKRYGIKAVVIETAYEYTVFGDFAINDMGDVTIEESDIEEYGVYDVKEQDEQEVQETVEQTEVEETAENAMAEVKTNSELHLDEEIVKAFEKQKSSFKFYGVDMAYQVERYVNCGSLKYVQLGTYSDYSKAVQSAYEAIKEWGEENIYFHTVEIAKRNSKTAKDKYDREILKSEKKEIGYYWYASRLTDSKECVHISIDSPIKIPIETTQKSEINEVLNSMPSVQPKEKDRAVRKCLRAVLT